MIGRVTMERLKLGRYRVLEVDHCLPPADAGCIDITQLKSLKRPFEPCVGIIHLAAVSRVIWGERDPELCWATNVEATQSLLDIALAMPSKPWFIYASSREVYGQQQQFPVSESAPLLPMNCYARSKFTSEEHVETAGKKGLRHAIIRFSSVYGGVDDHPDRVMPAFCRAAINQQSLRVEGAANTLDFTHVDDVARAIASAVNILSSGSNSLPTIHLTSGIGTTLKELAYLTCHLADSNSQHREVEPRNYDVHKFIGNPALAKQVLGWEPKITLHNGVARYIRDLRNALGLKVEASQAPPSSQNSSLLPEWSF